jgi:hypothetical protein
MKLPILRLALVLAAAFGAGGCGTIEKDKKNKAMDAALTTYNEAIRWGYFDTAYSYVHPGKRQTTPSYLENVRVTGYEVLQPPVVKDDTELEQVVRIEYVHEDTQRVRSLSDRQLWSYDMKTNTWWLQSGVPRFGYHKR